MARLQDNSPSIAFMFLVSAALIALLVYLWYGSWPF